MPRDHPFSVPPPPCPPYSLPHIDLSSRSRRPIEPAFCLQQRHAAQNYSKSSKLIRSLRLAVCTQTCSHPVTGLRFFVLVRIKNHTVRRARRQKPDARRQTPADIA